MTYTVTLKRGEERRILAGHPWVYANEVSKIEGDGGLGSLATVQSCNGTFLGKGYINHLSKILVRIFIRDPEEQDTEELFTERLFRANALRRDLGYDSAYRLCFSESDGLPSLIADKYGDVIVISILSLGFRKKRDMIVRALVKLFSPAAIYERSDSPVLKKEGIEPYSGLLYGALPEKTVIEENGLKLYVDVVNGQKTGYFLDQKENRMALRRYSVGKRVLDCFCNVGGFTLNAATVAKSVKAVDISERALEELKANAELNSLNNVTAECADVFEYLRDARKRNETYQTIILDPPAFCKSASEVAGAVRGYRDINAAAIKIIEDGGYLVTASCSHYMSAELFEKTLKEAGENAGRRLRILEKRLQASDHPALLGAPETEYLKLFVCTVSDKRSL